MDSTKLGGEEKVNAVNESHLGTWISVGVVGVVILITYFILFGLYMDRV